nr:MAG TPA: hypothetical protein [Caudoviricetes sp.]
MAEVNWIKGTIAPPESGDYYIILEAMQDSGQLPSGEMLIRKGDIEITNDWYDADRAEFDTIGKDNPIWRVLAWARMLKPSIPADIRDRVKWYFGMRVEHG